MFGEIFKAFKVPRRKNSVMVWQVLQRELIMCYQTQGLFGATLGVSSGSGKKKSDYQITAEFSQKL